MIKDIRTAHPDEEDNVRHAVNWNRRWGQNYGGFFYQEELFGPEGMDVQVFVTESTTDEEIKKAEQEARATQDVVAFGALLVPEEWLKPQIGKASDVVPTLRDIVEEHTANNITWPDGSTQLVDVVTASLLLQVYDAVADDTRKKMRRMMEKSRGEFIVVVEIAWGAMK